MFSVLVGELGRSCPLCSIVSVSASANHSLFFLYFLRCGCVTPNLPFGYILDSQEIVLAGRDLRGTPSPFFYPKVGLVILRSHLSHLSSLLLKSSNTGKPTPFPGDPNVPHYYRKMLLLDSFASIWLKCPLLSFKPIYVNIYANNHLHICHICMMYLCVHSHIYVHICVHMYVFIPKSEIRC